MTSILGHLHMMAYMIPWNGAIVTSLGPVEFMFYPWEHRPILGLRSRNEALNHTWLWKSWYYLSTIVRIHNEPLNHWLKWLIGIFCVMYDALSSASESWHTSNIIKLSCVSLCVAKCRLWSGPHPWHMCTCIMALEVSILRASWPSNSWKSEGTSPLWVSWNCPADIHGIWLPMGCWTWDLKPSTFEGRYCWSNGQSSRFQVGDTVLDPKFRK